VHGGAGSETAEERAPRRAGLARAAEAGWRVLARTGSALEAVVEAVVVLEDDPHFNAGLGSVLTVEGTLEMDASVMAGETLAAGAVGAVSRVANPVRLAHAVLAEGREVLLVGEAAAALAADGASAGRRRARRWGPWPAAAPATSRPRPRPAASPGSAAAGSATPR